jgi:hypothetical protein
MTLLEAMEGVAVDKFNREWIEAFNELDEKEMDDYILTKDGQLMKVHFKKGANQAECAPMGGGTCSTILLKQVEARGIAAIKKFLHYHRNWRWAKFVCGHVNEDGIARYAGGHIPEEEEERPVFVEALLQGFLKNGAFRLNGYCRPYFSMEGLQTLLEWMPERTKNEIMGIVLPSKENNMTLSFIWKDDWYGGVIEEYEAQTINGPDGLVEAWPWTQYSQLDEYGGPEPRKLNRGPNATRAVGLSGSWSPNLGGQD